MKHAFIVGLLYLTTHSFASPFNEARLITDENGVTNIETPTVEATLTPTKIAPCSKFALFFQEMGMNITLSDLCVIATVADNNSDATESVVAPLKFLDDKQDGDKIDMSPYPIYNGFNATKDARAIESFYNENNGSKIDMPFNPFNCKFPFSITNPVNAVCCASFQRLLTIARTAYDIPAHEKVSFARAHPDIKTGYEPLIFGWRRWFLSKETYESALTDDHLARLKAYHDGNVS